MQYGYVKKDELYHYGVKGMKWHKHLKQQRINLLGAKKTFGYVNDYLKRSYDGPFNGGSNKSINYLSRIYDKHGSDAFTKANVERSMKAADFYTKKAYSEAEAEINSKERAKEKAKKEKAQARQNKAKELRNKRIENRNKKVEKQQKKRELEEFLEKGRQNAAKDKVSTRTEVFSRKKSHNRNVLISKEKTKIPGVTRNGYIVQPKTISKKKRRR